MREKKVSESKTEMSQLMLPQNANIAGTVYGGVILYIADSVAYVCASRHAGPNCVTVSFDQVDFREPIRVGELVTFKASLNYVGRTSMEVGIRIEAENLETGERRHTNSCYVTMVALDKNGKPTEAPRLICETPLEKKRFREGQIRREHARELAEKRKQANL